MSSDAIVVANEFHGASGGDLPFYRFRKQRIHCLINPDPEAAGSGR